MLIRGDDLTQRRGKDRGVRIRRADAVYHSLEAVKLVRNTLAAGFRPFNAKRELEVLLIADKHIGKRGNLLKVTAKRILSPLPEGRTIVKVEGNERAVCLGITCYLKAGSGGALAHGGNKAGQMQNAHAILSKKPLQVKIRSADSAADLSSAVILDDGAAQAVARVGDIELMPVAPRAALRNIRPGITDITLAQLSLYEGCNGAVLHKARHDKRIKAQ